ncbi:MAG TPA: IS4 family transposase, partial [Polyangiaceae bacterium]|nr:IS4 family transposase [Polyangiaceae bacterium]
MVLPELFERFVEETPVTVMARATIEHALPPSELDALFEAHAERQYTRELLFSSVVDLMGVVVSKVQPSVHAAFKAVKGTLPVTLTALYDKLNHLEPAITSALVNHTAGRLESVIRGMHGELPPLVAGYRVRIIDGSHLAATQRRLDVLRGSIAGPLP